MDAEKIRQKALELGSLRGDIKKNKYNEPIPDINVDSNYYVYERGGREYVVPALSRREVVQMVRYMTGEMAAEYAGVSK